MSFSRFSREDLEIGKKIGSGGTSSVHHAILKSETSENTHVAAKKLYETNEDEVELLSKLSHPNIIKLIGVVSDTFECILILELCELGSLRAYIDKHGQMPLPSDLFDDWSNQAAKAIEYLQDQNIVHKDIKSENYTISSAMVLKLIDFGLAKEMELSLSDASCKGTFRYMAPELLRASKLSPTKYDIWAYGVVVWEMVTGKIPYEGLESNAQIVWYICEKNKRLEIPKDCPDHITELLYRCWQGDHKRRPDIHEILVDLDTKECNILKQWELQRRFGHEDGLETPKLDQAFGLAVDPKGNIAVQNNSRPTCQTRIYDCNGGLKQSLQSVRGPMRIWQRPDCPPLVTGPDGVLLTTINSSCGQVEVLEPTRNRTKYITILRRFELELGKLGGLAFDKYDNLLVGICGYENIKGWEIGPTMGVTVKNLIVVMEYRKALKLADQTNDVRIDIVEERQIPVKQRPIVIAVTPLDTIIVSDLPPSDHQIITIINLQGEVLHKLNAPPQVMHWRPYGICCSSDNIFITNDNLSAPDEYGVYCYSLSGDYLGCATKEVTNPTGIAVTHDGQKMVVAQYEKGNPEEGKGKHGVKVFQKKSK